MFWQCHLQLPQRVDIDINGKGIFDLLDLAHPPIQVGFCVALQPIDMRAVGVELLWQVQS